MRAAILPMLLVAMLVGCAVGNSGSSIGLDVHNDLSGSDVHGGRYHINGVP
jgi:ABC-type enterobactin transport system permease subunit